MDRAAGAAQRVVANCDDGCNCFVPNNIRHMGWVGINVVRLRNRATFTR